jgi:hypothetical protein
MGEPLSTHMYAISIRNAAQSAAQAPNIIKSSLTVFGSSRKMLLRRT